MNVGNPNFLFFCLYLLELLEVNTNNEKKSRLLLQTLSY